jgi:large subunit ribosomal protein L29
MPLKSDEIRDMSDGDIHARVAQLEEERFRLKFRSATEPLENPLQLRTIRRDIARLKTILRERQLAAAAAAAGTREAGGREAGVGGERAKRER